MPPIPRSRPMQRATTQRRTRRLRRTAALTVALAAACAGTAHASSLVYVKAGDIWASSPDGARQVQISRGGGYAEPSQADDGTIVATRADGRLYRLSRDGALLNEPVATWLAGGAPAFTGPMGRSSHPTVARSPTRGHTARAPTTTSAAATARRPSSEPRTPTPTATPIRTSSASSAGGRRPRGSTAATPPFSMPPRSALPQARPTSPSTSSATPMRVPRTTSDTCTGCSTTRTPRRSNSAR